MTMAQSLEKPRIIKGTSVGLGLLAFFSIVACTSIHEQLPEQAIATGLRAIAANIAFIGVLSNTKAGRIAAIIVLGLIAIGGVFGLLVGVRDFMASPVLSTALLALSIGFVMWFVAYTFGRSARTYYSAKWANTQESKNA
jgi:hypothetical protein